MNKVIAFFNFNFLKKIDRYLLLNHSKIWVFKLPYVLFYGFILNLLLLIMLLLTEINMYDVPEFTSSITVYWLIIIYYVFKVINNNIKLEKEYGRSVLSGLEEFLLLLFTMFILGTSLVIVQNTIFLKKYPYETKNHEKLLVYVDNDDYTKTLAIENLEALEKSEYKEEYIQIILDLSSIDKREEITDRVIAKAKENYMFYYDLNSYEWIGVEWVMLLVFSLLMVYYRVIGMKNLWFVFLVVLPIIMIGTVDVSLATLIGITIYQFIIIGLVYLFTKNKLLSFSMISLSSWMAIVFIIDMFTENLKFPLNLISLLVVFIVTILCISPVKRKLLELEAEPKEL